MLTTAHSEAAVFEREAFVDSRKNKGKLSAGIRVAPIVAAIGENIFLLGVPV